MNLFLAKKKTQLSGISLLLCIVIASATSQMVGDASLDDFLDPYTFSKEEYEKYMGMIKKIDPTVYAQMKKGEALTRIPALKGARNGSMVADGTEETQGYPTMYLQVLDQAAPYYREEDQISLFTTLVNEYKDRPISPPITKREQKLVMDTIKYLAPDLYAAIIKVDPTGKNHITRDYTVGVGASVVASKVDGLPEISLDMDEAKLPLKEFRFSIAHELGHYVLEHDILQNTKLATPIHRALGKQGATDEFKKGKKVSGQLPFEETFQNAYSRIDESEADRFAVIEMGIPIDDAISLAKRDLAKYESDLQNPEKEMLKRTHPLWKARIEQLESLRREVEINKARKAKPKPINWQALAEEYMQKYAAQ